MRYKLLKDLPFTAKGHIYDETGLLIDGPNFIKGLPGEINEEIELAMKLKGGMFSKWFEPVNDKTIYDLQEGEECYVIYGDGRIAFTSCLNTDNNINILNAFITKQEAEQELEKRKAMASIKKWIHDNDKGYKFDNTRYNYYIYFNEDEKELEIDSYSFARRHSDIYYSSQEIAEKALKELESEYTTLFLN